MRGVFWIVEDELKAFVFEEGAEHGVAKSGNTFNHKLLWEHVRPAGCSRAFDYYPRGRVEYNGRGKPVVYMNPHIKEKMDLDILARICYVLECTPADIVKYEHE